MGEAIFDVTTIARATAARLTANDEILRRRGWGRLFQPVSRYAAPYAKGKPTLLWSGWGRISW